MHWAVDKASTRTPARIQSGLRADGVSQGAPRIYLLFRRPSSMYEVQNPLGLALVAFLITVIFIVIS